MSSNRTATINVRGHEFEIREDLLVKILDAAEYVCSEGDYVEEIEQDYPGLLEAITKLALKLEHATTCKECKECDVDECEDREEDFVYEWGED